MLGTREYLLSYTATTTALAYPRDISILNCHFGSTKPHHQHHRTSPTRLSHREDSMQDCSRADTSSISLTFERHVPAVHDQQPMTRLLNTLATYAKARDRAMSRSRPLFQRLKASLRTLSSATPRLPSGRHENFSMLPSLLFRYALQWGYHELSEGEANRKERDRAQSSPHTDFFCRRGPTVSRDGSR